MKRYALHLANGQTWYVDHPAPNLDKFTLRALTASTAGFVEFEDVSVFGDTYRREGGHTICSPDFTRIGRRAINVNCIVAISPPEGDQ